MATCWKCGADLGEGALTCAACKAPVAPPPPPPPAPQAESERRLALFVGEKYPVYARKWARMREKGRAISWNWATAFLFVGWLGYRGLYRIAWIVIAIDFVEFAIEGFFDTPSAMSGLFSVALGLAVTLNANRWYRQHAETSIAAIEASAAPAAVDAEIVRQGGGSWKAGVGLFVLWAVSLFVAAFIPELVAVMR